MLLHLQLLEEEGRSRSEAKGRSRPHQPHRPAVRPGVHGSRPVRGDAAVPQRAARPLRQRDGGRAHGVVGQEPQQPCSA